MSGGSSNEGGGTGPTEQGPLPPKPDVAMALIQTAPSVFVHLDPRGVDVLVPSWFKKQPQLVLQVGMNMAVPIPDLDIGEEALSCTLSFNKRPEFCRIPWDAIYGLVGDDGRGMIWPESVPAEVAAAAEGRSPVKKEAKKPRLRLASSDSDEPTNEEPAVADKPEESASPGLAPVMEEVEEAEPTDPEDANSTSEEPPSKDNAATKLPPYLRVVK